MNNIIETNFGHDKQNIGYLIHNKNKAIYGVYCGDIAAMKLKDGNIVIGTKNDDSIEKATFASMDQMNQFCIMWLSIFDPDVIKYDDE